jgi:tripeptidyl-peptidase II
MGNDDDDLLVPQPPTLPHSFPYEHLIPKADTQVLEFLTKYPHYDGRNVTVGILDTGIDPGAPTLRDFGNADAKLLNVVDCTGAGDVDLSYETHAEWTKLGTSDDDDDVDSQSSHEYCWTVHGLSGQTLYLNPNWNLQPFPQEENDDPADGASKMENGDNERNNSDEKDTKTVPVRLAVKRGYELFPRPLRSRIQEHRKKLFQTEISKYVGVVRSKLAKLDDDNNNKNDNGDGKSKGSGSDDDPSATATSAALEKTKTRQDLQALLEVLTDKEWEQEATDPGPLYDVVVFYNGQDYRALLLEVHYDQQQQQQEAAAAKRMMNLVPLAAFSVERQYATFGVQDQYHYAVHFYDSGRILSIVRDSSPHGSHVASICSSTDEPPPQQLQSSSLQQGGGGSGPRRHGVAPVCIHISP